MQELYSPTPDPGLAPYITRIGGYRLSGFEPGIHVGMPGPTLTVTVPFDEPIVVAGPGGPPTAYGAMVAGLHDAPVHIHHDGHQHGIQLDLSPLGARALLGVPAGAIAGEMLDLSDLLQTVQRSLAVEAASAPTWRDRVDVVLTALTRRLADDRSLGPHPEVDRAWAQIRRLHGCVPVRAVAADVGWSTRHLGEQFRAEYGVSPKTAARLTRFARARRMIGRGVPLAEAAVRCGYVDQSHLNRDWRGFVGLSPTRWAAEDQLAFVQDPGAPAP